MVSTPDRTRSSRRRIAGERSRVPAGPHTLPAPREDSDTRDRDVRPRQPRGLPTDPAGPGVDARPATDARTAGPARWSVSVPDTTGGSGSPSSGPPRWVLAVLAALLVVALALDAVVVWRELSQQQAEEDAARALHSAVIQAPTVAERAATAVLSFEHDTLDKDIAEAERYLSDDFRPKYVASIREVVAEPADEVRATVQAEVLSSGVVEASASRSDVLLFVDQTTTKSTSSEPTTALNRVVFTMVRGDDGGWVVDEIKAY